MKVAEQKATVTVVGGGLAGLTAAYELEKKNYRVRVLEAGNRLGGKVKTVRHPLDPGLYSENGATRIPSHHHLTLEYAHQFGLELTPFFPDKDLFTTHYQGKRVREIQPGKALLSYIDGLDEHGGKSLNHLENDVLVKAFRELGEADPDGPLPACAARYDAVSFSRFLKEEGVSKEIRDLFHFDMYEPDYKNKVSALYVLHNLLYLKGMNGAHRIQGGNDQLIEALAERLKGPVRTQCPVTHIHWDQHSARVRARPPQGPEWIRSDYLVCALPFSVLRNMVVTPGFSRKKTACVEGMPFLKPARFSVQVSERFWKEQGLNGFARTDRAVQIWDLGFAEGRGKAVLEIYVRSEQMVNHLQTLDKPKQDAFLLDYLETVIPGIKARTETISSCFWGLDPWAQGGYNYFKPGQMTRFYPELTRPEGRIHFAGAHTSPWFVWMQGAIHSGRRVSREIENACRFSEVGLYV